MPELILDKDVETILKEKIAYHRDQAKLHLKLASDTKDMLTILTGKKEESHSEKTRLPLTANTLIQHSVESAMTGFKSLNEELSFSVTQWKPRVERVLRNTEISMKTEEILREIDQTLLIDDKIRKSAIGAVSSSLFSLVEKGLVVKLPNTQGKGNYYKWVK